MKNLDFGNVSVLWTGRPWEDIVLPKYSTKQMVQINKTIDKLIEHLERHEWFQAEINKESDD